MSRNPESAPRPATETAAAVPRSSAGAAPPALGAEDTAGRLSQVPEEVTTHEFDATAQWIGRDNPVPRPSPGRQPPAPLLRRDFRLADRPERAELHTAGLGYSVAEINGRAVSDALLDPPPSQYDRTAYSRTIDVTELLHEGENTLGVVLGRSYVSGVGGPDAVWACEPPPGPARHRSERTVLRTR